MKTKNVNKVGLALGVAVGLQIFFSAYSGAAVYTYSALLDTDNNPLTGGGVTVVQGTETPHEVTGIDSIVRVSVDDATGILGPISVERYDAGSLSFVTSVTGSESYGMGFGVGYNGFDAAEFTVYRPDMGNPSGVIAVTYVASTGGNSDYTQSFTFDVGRRLENIPVLSDPAMLALLLGLAICGVALLARRRARVSRAVAALLALCGGATVAWAAVVTLDGQVGDWQGIAPAVTDPIGDSSLTSGNRLIEDIVAGFMSTSQTNLNFRVDVVGQSLDTVVGSSSVPVLRRDSCGRTDGRLCESLIGNTVTDAMRSNLGVDFAIMNSGGLRADLTCPVIDLVGDFCPAFTPPPYPIVNGQVYSVLPFGNRAVTLSINGAELKTMLENGVSQMPTAAGRFPQVSGLCFTYDIHAAAGSRVTGAVRQAANGSCTGSPIGLTAASTYTIAEPDFMAKGGDGYPDFTGRFTIRDSLDQIVTAHVVGNSPISPTLQGRINCTTSGATLCPTLAP
jgi:hypothetical protein